MVTCKEKERDFSEAILTAPTMFICVLLTRLNYILLFHFYYAKTRASQLVHCSTSLISTGEGTQTCGQVPLCRDYAGVCFLIKNGCLSLGFGVQSA